MTQHDRTPDEHSGIVGGSSAGRVMGCPGSVAMIAKLQAQLDAEADALLIRADQAQDISGPEAAALRESAERIKNSLDQSSSYADEGTALHEVMAYILENDVLTDTLSADTEIDRIFDENQVEGERFFDAVLPAARAFDKLYTELEIEDYIIEQRVVIGEIEGAFGTSDVIAKCTAPRTVIVDWKFGSGVPVYASYKIDDVEFGNDQTMFYAAGALQTYPEMFGGAENPDDVPDDWEVVLVIVQPRVHEDEPQVFRTNVKALRNFMLDLVDAVAAAQAPGAELAIGSYCRFAKCKTICPLHLNGAEAAAMIGDKLTKLKLAGKRLEPEDTVTLENMPAVLPPGVPDFYLTSPGEMFAWGLEFKERLEPVLAGIAADAQAYLEAGGTIPGYKLVPKKAGWDSWEDDDKAEKFLGRQGIPLEERRTTKPITPAAARTRLKAMGKDEKSLKALEKYVKPGVSSGHTMAPESDSRPAVLSTPTMIGELANKLAAVGQ